ncbi:hypothetical protein HPB52_004144 [Rhipicephalus sanguineus]|uniref:SAP domain-containing protein n=1 Tax=Rhipicephalus sanguineus TaxID=34632 RepID=A0A9D4T8I9_RHISA|nr:hypothetical protein HPB52_004144 [Rhipicephalus sanguineus]
MVAFVTKSQPVSELRARGLPCAGLKDDLVDRFIRDNVRREATAPTDASTFNEAANDDDRQAHLETLSADNTRLRAELDTRRHANAGRKLARLARGASTTSPIQIHSTSDTASCIAVFDGTSQQSARQVERTAALAHWTPSLSLASAANPLAKTARDWHSAYGWRNDTWENWRDALAQRFRRRLTMQEFMKLQAKRRLGDNETIVEYMCSKSAILDKAPYLLAEDERISLILSGIDDDTWAHPLAAQVCFSVTELIDKATLLDARHQATVYVPKTTTCHRLHQSIVRKVLIDEYHPATLTPCGVSVRTGPIREPRVHEYPHDSASTAATSVICPAIVANPKLRPWFGRKNDVQREATGTK